MFSLRLPALALVLTLLPTVGAQTPCLAGSAGGYACDGIDLMAHLPLSTFATPGSGAPSAGNDIWGWTDAASGREFALMGLTNGIAFVEVTDPAAPVFLGKLPTATSASSWRDVKTYAGYAFVVAEAGGHGMQVFDLGRLLTASGPAVTFDADARYTGFGKAHNIVLDEASGLAFGVGANQGGYACNGGGLHIVDVSTPTAPTFAGCYDGDGYTHDAQCLVYDGPDADHVGTPICVASNEDTVTIVDLTDPAAPVQLGRAFYPSPSYTHQGWFSNDQRWFIVNDELDGNGSTPTRTLVMDLADLDDPAFGYAQSGTSNARDHNLYVRGDRVFQSNYSAGLRVLDASGVAGGALPEIAFFDTYPANDSFSFDGQWSNYPYLPSGALLASDIAGGLFVMALGADGPPPVASVSPPTVSVTAQPGETVTATVTVANSAGAEGGDLFLAASVRNLSQPDDGTARLAARPVAARPVVDAELGPKGGPSSAAARLGGGGPDAFGYAWTDSNEPGGPAVAFHDISASGTALTFTASGDFDPLDEGYADVALPIAFSFYGVEQSSVRVFSNGFLTFSAFGSNSFNNGDIPSPATPNALLAPFWADLDASGGGAIYAGETADGRFAVQYDAVPRFEESDPLTFQVLLSPDGTIEFQYGTMTGDLVEATVGIESPDGTDGLAVSTNAAYVTSDLAVRFIQPVVWARVTPGGGSAEPGASVPLDLTFDATGLPEGTYSGELTIVTNDPSLESVTVPLTFTVAVGTGTDDAAATPLALSAPVPNPSRGTARVAFGLAEAGTARLSVVDALGRTVAVLAEGDLAAGRHTADFDGAALAAGVYVLRLDAGGQVLTQRATVTR